LLKANFAPEELQQHKNRIKQLAKGDILAAGATQSAIQAVQAAIMVAAIMPAMTVATTSSR
jgi:siroheme synthase